MLYKDGGLGGAYLKLDILTLCTYSDSFFIYSTFCIEQSSTADKYPTRRKRRRRLRRR
jgi:hypothetical protein